MSSQIPLYTDVIAASERISGLIHHTPVLTSISINEICNAELFFKCENLQKVGAFKFRGACNAVMSLSDQELRKGVCTHSSGNHAQALSLAAKLLGTKAYIVMPENAPKVKVDAVRSYGAEIIFCKANLKAREDTLAEVQKRTSSVFIHPYDNFKVIAGQGTAALELIKNNPNLNVLLAPVGGGGLMSGTSIITKHLLPKALIYGAEPKNANDAQQSLIKNRLIPSIHPETIADGLLTSLSEQTFQILSKNLNGILTCSESGIIKAMKLMFERMKIVVEPSGAVPLAVILENPEMFYKKKVGLIISGGNLDLANLPF